MKETLKISSQAEKIDYKIFIEAAITHIAVALCGFITSRASVLSGLLPFGIAFLAGSSVVYTPAAAVGTFLGYFIPAFGKGGFRYTAAVFSLLAIKLLLGGYKKITENPLFTCLIAFLASILTSAAATGKNDSGFIYPFAESLLAAGGAYFVCKLFRSFKGISSGFTTEELCSFFAVTGMILTALNAIAFGGVSLGHIISVFLILTSAKYGGILTSMICGISSATALILSGGSAEIGVVYAFTGLVSGVLSAYGKYALSFLPPVLSLIGSMTLSNPVTIAVAVTEGTLGSSLFLILPKSAGIVLSRFFSLGVKTVGTDSLKNSLTMRLEIAANALSDVSQTVEQVSSELSKINAPDFGKVITAIEQDACAGCKLRLHCWESRRSSTVDAILAITKAIKDGSRTPETAAPDEFRGRCLRISRLGNAAYRRYSDYTSRISAENRIDEVRSVVSDQFDGISYMLSGLAHDLKSEDRLDTATAEKTASALKNLNIDTREATAITDKYGRMTVELKIRKTPDLIINKLDMMKLVSLVCERDFDVPSVHDTGGYIFASLHERTALRIEIGIEQKSASDSNMCGDAYKYFFDGRGHFIMLLSDGMGTGGRAAVDGAMASGLMSRLIKAGFGYDCALKILNSSMLFKSTDESLATLDIASIDLYNGQVELYKAGAAPTIIRRSGKTGKAESTSLPAGILREISFDKAAVKCRVGDIIVLMSDGAVCDGTEWIRDEVSAWEAGAAEELAARISEGARRRRSDSHEDDITVMVAILKKACG